MQNTVGMATISQVCLAQSYVNTPDLGGPGWDLAEWVERSSETVALQDQTVLVVTCSSCVFSSSQPVLPHCYSKHCGMCWSVSG